MSDYIVRAAAADLQIRAFAITSRELVEKARSIHNTSPVATAALGRLLSAGSMMGAMMKGEQDLLTLQIKGDGPIGGITVTADSKARVKGYVNEPAVLIPGATRSTPLESVRSPILVARVSKVGILQGVNTATSGFDEDIAEMYAEKIKGLNGKIAEKSEGKAAVFVKELKLIYSLDIRDALTMVAFNLFVLTRSS